MITGFLPIGSVVLLKDSKRRLMINGYLQKSNETGKVWDYCGILYPEGYLNADNLFLFNNDQIDQIYALGYQDAEQFAMLERLKEAAAKLADNK